MRTTQFRQGDVLLVREDDLGCIEQTISDAAKTAPAAASIVVAVGEKAGHAHELSGQDVRQLYENCYVVLRTTKLTHPEHAAIELEPGVYFLTRQRVYRPEESQQWSD